MDDAKPASAVTEHLFDITAAPTTAAYMRDAWRRREFATVVPMQDLRAQNMDTVLGQVWHLLNPALLVAVYFLIFGVLLDTDRGVDNFLAFLIIGVILFHMTQRVVQEAAVSISQNLGLIRSIQFPRILLPAAAVNGQSAASVPALALLLASVVATGESPSLRWLVFPGVLVAQFLFNFGAALIVARVGATVRDLRQLLPHLFRLLFYASGIIFSVEAFVHSEAWRRAFAFNPIYDIVTCARWCLLGGEIDVWIVWGLLVWSIVIVIAGFAIFRRSERRLGA